MTSSQSIALVEKVDTEMVARMRELQTYVRGGLTKSSPVIVVNSGHFIRTQTPESRPSLFLLLDAFQFCLQSFHNLRFRQKQIVGLGQIFF